MRAWHKTLVLALAMAALCLGAPTASLAETGEPELSEATSAIVVDSAGNVLYEKNPDDEINMASVTKVMTAVVALESGVSLDTTVTCVGCTLDENAMLAGYSAGDVSSLRDLMRAMLVYSANDAAVEVAVATGGSESAFVQKMNDKAAELGMTHTHFENPHGLDADGHHSSVHDLAILARYAMTNYPFIHDTVGSSYVTVPVGGVETTLPTVDYLLGNYSGLLGVKTGAGNYVTAFMGCARRNNTTLYTVVLGCQTKDGRFADTVSLLDWAFGTYEDEDFATSGASSATTPFAYDFSYKCLVAAAADASGYVWPEGDGVTSQAFGLKGDLAETNQVVGMQVWSQQGRTVSLCTYKTASTLLPASSGLGLVEELAPALAVA